MNLAEARRETMALIDAGNAVILSSGSGIGKSQTAYSIFEEIRDRDAQHGISWGFHSVFAATQQPTDLVGIQFKGERKYTYADPITQAPVEKTVTVTDPALPVWMMSSEGKPAFMYDRCFLLIDEYGQGEADTKRALAEVFLNGGTTPWYLPLGSVRIGATNEGARYGVSKDFDFCIARRTFITIEGDIEQSLRFFDKPYWHQGKQWLMTPVVKAWAAANPQIVFEKEPDKQGPWCNPRQLCSVDRYLQVKWKMQGNQEIEPPAINTIAGTIGMGATQSLLAHLQFLLELPSYDEVVQNPTTAPVPQRADLLMLMAYQMAGYTQVQHLAECIAYIQRMPKDMGVTYISSLLRRDYKGIINHPAMQAWINKNATLVAVISSLSAN